MRKIKNSIKAIICFVCVFLVAVATIVTVVLINKKRENGGDDVPPSYMLTTAQKKLGSEINSSVNTSVSSQKSAVFEYAQTYANVMDISEVSYFDESVCWSGDGLVTYKVCVLDNPETATTGSAGYTELLTKIGTMEEFSDYSDYDVKIINAGKNHFRIKFSSGNNVVYALVTVENYDVTVNKIFAGITYNSDENCNYLGENEFNLYFSQDYFVVLDNTVSGSYSYNFYEYLSSYSNYEPFKLSISDSDVNKAVDIIISTFQLDSETVVTYSETLGFMLEEKNTNENEVTFRYSKLALTQTKTISDASENKSELDNNGSYYTYSYSLAINDENVEFDMQGFDRVSIIYAGNDYFGVFYQKINSNHTAETSGEMVYYDYNLKKIASFSAESSASSIIYVDNNMLLTKEGMFSTKNDVKCTKIFDFSNLNAEFDQVLASGNFVLKDSYDNLIVYKFDLSKAFDLYMDEIVAYPDDNCLIFKKNNSYYIYYFSTNTVTSINYVESSLPQETKLFITKDASGSYSLRSSRGAIESGLSKINIDKNYITTTKNGSTKNYVVSNSSLTTNSGVEVYSSRSGSVTESLKSENTSSVTSYSLINESFVDSGSSSSSANNDVVYDYENKIEKKEITDVNTDESYEMIVATHCIQDGLYSNCDYYDYFEIGYDGGGLGSKYRPLRLYYRVNIVNGSPVLSVINYGHIALATVRSGGGHTNETESFDYKVVAADEKINVTTKDKGVQNLAKTDLALSTSYDTYTDDDIYLYKYNSENGYTYLTQDNKLTEKIDQNTETEYYCKAEVYGESIKVTLCFVCSVVGGNDAYDDFDIESTNFGVTEFKDSEFFLFYQTGVLNPTYQKETDVNSSFNATTYYATSEVNYFGNYEYNNTLYIQPVVVGLQDSALNYTYLLDFANIYEKYGEKVGDGTILTTDYHKTYIEGKNVESAFLTSNVYYYILNDDGSEKVSNNTCYFVCINGKQPFDSTKLTELYLGFDNTFTKTIVGGKIIGLTSPLQNNSSTLSSDLYNSSMGTYIDDKIEFRADASTETAVSDIRGKYTGIAYNEASKYYSITYENPSYIYVDGGLNTYRYIYCVYEPETFKLQIDYNVATEGRVITEDNDEYGGIDNEIDYLKNYVGISIGTDTKNTINYANSWAYKNTTNETDFGNYYNNEDNDKYKPSDFTNNYVRQGNILNEDGTFTDEYIKNQQENEVSAVVKEYITDEYRYFYIVIDGVKYFFQVNTKDQENPLAYNQESNGNENKTIQKYLVAYKNINSLTNFDGNYGYLEGTEDYNTFENYNTFTTEVSKNDDFYYNYGDDQLYIRVVCSNNVWYAHYHQYNIHERSSEYENTHYYYENGVLKERSYSNSTITETFTFMYNDEIKISSIPSHIHYNFAGFDVYYYDTTQDMWVKDEDFEINITSIASDSEVNINPFKTQDEEDASNYLYYYLASKLIEDGKNKYYTNGIIGADSKPIKLVAKWVPAEITVNAVIWTTNNNGANYDAVIYENNDFRFDSISERIQPVLKMGETDIDLKDKNGFNGADGIIDAKITFSYLKTKTFAEINTTLVERGYKSDTINTTGINFGFGGWTFLPNNQQDQSYYSIDSNAYSGTTLEAGNMALTTIAEYVADTTEITVFAYYLTQKYNFSIELVPMGGATKNLEDVDREDGSKWVQNFREHIFNDVTASVHYLMGVHLSTDSGGYQYSTQEDSNYEQLGIPVGNTNYYKSFDNVYYSGSSIVINLKIDNENYYYKRIIVRNITLKNNINKYEKFTITFEYVADADNNFKWTAKAVGDQGTTLVGVYNDTDGGRGFTFGDYNTSSEVNYNYFSLGGSESELTINISNLSWPGTLDYDNQQLTGESGFSMEIAVESFSIKNEEVSFVYKDSENEDVNDYSTIEDIISYNRASLISAQPVTDNNGNALGSSVNGYIWINAKKYCVKSDVNSPTSGFYRVSPYTDPSSVGNDFEMFVNQSSNGVNQDDSMIVYYDVENQMVYYLADFNSSVDYEIQEETLTVNKVGSDGNLSLSFSYNGVRYFIAKQSSLTEEVLETLNGKCLLLRKNAPNGYKSSVYNEKIYNSMAYRSGDEDLYGYFYKDTTDNKLKVRFRVIQTIKKAEASESIRNIGYNNTRVMVIDPEQAMVNSMKYYESGDSIPSFSTYYELKYYISSITIGNCIYSFDQITRSATLNDGKYYSYGLFEMNNRINENGYIVQLSDDYIGKTFEFLGVTYTINDAYKLSLSKDNSYDGANIYYFYDGANIYYFYLARDNSGFSRYFIFYDECQNSNPQSKTAYDFSITFKKIQNQVNINVTEENVYGHSTDSSTTSFDLLISNNSTQKNEYTSYSADRTDNDYDNAITNKTLEKYWFYELLDDGANKTDFEDVLSTSVSWSSLFYYDPTQSIRYSLSAKSGYVIKSITLQIGRFAYTKGGETSITPDNFNHLIIFELDESASFENLLHFSSGNYSFTGTIEEVFKSVLVYNIYEINGSGDKIHTSSSTAFGYVIGDTVSDYKRGLMYSNLNTNTWTYGVKDTYTLDYIFLLISSMYEDVKIDISTTSYTEFLFENSDGSLLRRNVSGVEEGKNYKDISIEDDTYFTFYIQETDELGALKEDNEGNPILKELEQYDAEGNEIFTLRYYPNNPASGSVIGAFSKGTIRMIFFGTGSYIKNGIYVLATTDDHSVYFTNARFYNERTSDGGSDSATEPDAFKNLGAYSGRTNDDEKIVNTLNNCTLNKTNKMVYFYTGALMKKTYYNSSLQYTCEPNYFSSHYKDDNDSNGRFFLALEARLNEINIQTDSYLYNDVLTTSNALQFTEDGIKNSYGMVAHSLGYTYIFGENSDNSNNKLLRIRDEIDYNTKYIYQLDNVYKTNSWFNDTVLSNIQYYANKEGYNDDDKIKTWVNRSEENAKESELALLKSGGLDFYWNYYEIAGYFLQYIMIEIADLDAYYVIDVSSRLSGITSNDTDILIGEFELKGTNNFTYNFELRYVCDSDSEYGYFTFYPVAHEKDDNGESTSIIDVFRSVSLMSNSVKVAFVSNAYSYDIYYHGEYIDGTEVNKGVSTYNDSDNYLKIKNNSNTNGSFNKYYQATNYIQTIRYDSMVKLNYELSMYGYTFIGWGNEKYFDGENLSSRFTAGNGENKAPQWSTQSSWYDPTDYFVKANKTGLANAESYYDYIKDYSSGSKPGTAFYTNGGYFMTDTGNKEVSGVVLTQNYNFFANYVTEFSSKIGKAKTSYGTTDAKINLYPIFKANTYAIKFNPNNKQEDKYYLNYGTGENWLNTEFLTNNIGFSIVETVGSEEKTTNYVAYVTFDTCNWSFLSSSGISLLYAYFGDPYTVTSMSDTNNTSKLAIDMYGYTWLGWYYTKLDDTKQNYTSVAEIDNTTMVFGSKYTKKKGKTVDLPTFTVDFINKITEKNPNSIVNIDEGKTQRFIYYGQHKCDSEVDFTQGYVYFYDYTGEEKISNGYSYQAVSDYLNTFKVTTDSKVEYEEHSETNILLSYYDTSLSKDAYEIKQDAYGEFYLSLNKSVEKKTFRTIELFAGWSWNDYTTVYATLDWPGRAINTFEVFGSTTSSNIPNSGQTYWFNEKKLEEYLIDMVQPSRVGYDFVGWSFNYIPVVYTSEYSAYTSSINTPSQYLYLCKEMLAQYSSLDGLNGSKTNSYESNVLMIDGNRLKRQGTDANKELSEWLPTWILNETGKAEHLGDEDSIDGTQRYVYLFPVWKVQTFQINISLNITKENLENLYDKDSNFALGLYNVTDGVGGNFNFNSFTGITSKYYTYNTTATAKNLTNNLNAYNNYFNDIVANICFEITFDQPFSSATLSFNGKTYTLRELFATSAGYYFLGLMYEQTKSGDNLIVTNALKSVLTLDGLENEALNEENASGQVPQSSVDADKYFENYCYAKLYRTRQASNSPDSSGDYKKLGATNSVEATAERTDYLGYSTNFGSINLSTYKYNLSDTASSTSQYIMSELYDGKYYLYILNKNVKYYVVIYLYNHSDEKFSQPFTFDKTFLYYNETIGTTNYKYIVSYDSDGNPYYVKDGFSNRIELNTDDNGYMYIALYTYRTNELNIKSGAIVEYDKDSAPDGSLLVKSTIKGKLTFISDGFLGIEQTVTFTPNTTRQFTLYAHWSNNETDKPRVISSEICNGNNSGTNSSSNLGLAGWYSITSDDASGVSTVTTGGSSVTSENTTKVTSTANNNSSIKLEYKYFSTVNYEILPFYNGRYLSEMTWEFDTLSETNSGVTSNYKMSHNILTFKLAWDNVNKKITISSVTLNGVNAGNVVNSISSSTYSYYRNAIAIDILSALDMYNVKDSSGGIMLYNYNEYSDMQGRTDINAVNFKFTNTLTSFKCTCKYSIQTYNIKIYNIFTSNTLTSTDDGKFKTVFTKLDDMLNSSNYNPDIASTYFQPYDSSVNYSNTYISTIKTDCASGTVSYNVPYGYFLNDDVSVVSDVNSYNKDFYGFEYIYKNGYYSKGLNESVSISKQFDDSLSKTTGNKIKYTSSTNTFKGWYVYDTIATTENGYVVLDGYNQQAMVQENKTIYGYNILGNSSTKVLFYYWDKTDNKYMQYTGNIDEYTYSSGTNDDCQIVKGADGKLRLKNLPSIGIEEWKNGKQFIGYIYLTDGNVHNITSDSAFDSEYDTTDMQEKTAYISKDNEIYSALKSKYSDKADDYYRYSGINSMNIFDLIKYEIQVYEHEYYTTKTTLNSKEVNVLDAIRTKIRVDIKTTENGSTTTPLYVQKDFKMLNVGTELSVGTTYYAIPIYVTYESPKIKTVLTKGNDKFVITTVGDYTCSNVFECTSKYTIYHDPDKELRFAVVNNTDNITITNLTQLTAALSNTITMTSASTGYFYTLESKEITNSGGAHLRYEYSSPDITLSLSSVNQEVYVVPYYMKNGEVVFEIGDYITITKTDSGYGFSCETEASSTIVWHTIDYSKGTLDDIIEASVIRNTDGSAYALTGNYLDAAKRAFADMTVNYSAYYATSTAKTLYHVKLFIVLCLQILQKNVIKYENRTHYYARQEDSFSSGDKDYNFTMTHNQAGISEAQNCYDLIDCIEAINEFNYAVDKDTTSKKLLTDCFGFVRLACSIGAAMIYYGNTGTSYSSPGGVSGLKVGYSVTLGYPTISTLESSYGLTEENVTRNNLQDPLQLNYDYPPGTFMFDVFSNLNDGGATTLNGSTTDGIKDTPIQDQNATITKIAGRHIAVFLYTYESDGKYYLMYMDQSGLRSEELNIYKYKITGSDTTYYSIQATHGSDNYDYAAWRIAFGK